MYGGTKTEMERLLADAEKFSGVKYDIKNLSDVYSAIHVIQEELGVTGTTALEAKKTISGSVNSMKAAFDNFLNGSGSPKALAEAITNVLINIGTSIQKLLPGLVEGLGTLTSSLLPILTDMLWELLPSFMDAIRPILILYCFVLPIGIRHMMRFKKIYLFFSKIKDVPHSYIFLL